MTTIARYVTGENLAAQLVMARAAQAVKRPVILTEGDKDRRVLRVIVGDLADVHPGSGKADVLDALNYIDPNAAGEWLIAFVDADFDRVRGVKYPPTVILTDSHDMDVEHIRSGALVKIIQEVCSEGKCAKIFGISAKTDPEALAGAIRSKLLQLARPVALLRLLSLENDYQLRFKRIDPSKFVEAKSIDIDERRLVSVVMSSGAKEGVTERALLTALRKAASETHDDWQLCQGHDLAKLFVLAIRKKWGIGKISADEIERLLRSSYEPAFFWATAMGQTLANRLRTTGPA